MLTIEEIKALIKEMDSSSISELKFESDDAKVTLRKADAFAGKTVVQAIPESAPIQVPAQPQPFAQQSAPEEQTVNADKAEEASLHRITAPMVGTFYSSSSPDADAFVQKGSKIDKKSVVCIIEAMKLFNEIEADCKGTIVDILAEDGQLVEYGQPLFLVRED
ncbi:acetyl-CoA carboxylase biotin carboxyl carrier protein [Sporolactobacillus sp. CPB3-1]|uniref:Biotin carboxyl carrier protein of acetyl-CoA carboxylase n=1 Tax=Sporolactobacillus mangiferae TaxID=2940498 RepID=A0ABT0MCF8_9BACL|nr:acetyl-CoA carboxylase biotin carboxyl carrier protein [Sporolactobacillus mangiferae]MCL1632567.1 acetyl-CoA carboxylase biotin carboxyl carrier protein [Sporolactobacillus mangiferae]